MDRLSVIAFAALPSFATACMGIGPMPVRFAGQTNIVIWDGEREVEHFVRDARFETKGASLGFVAPTPTRPEIEAVSDSAFVTLASMGPPMRGAPYPGGFGGGMGGGGGVAVIERKKVAGYEATVLKASDGAALAQWMRQNEYPIPRFAGPWLARYVRAGWYVTAFKVATGGGEGSTGPVRMTFRAAVPFNPYSVPAENTGKGGLSLYYISKGDEVAKLGRTDPWMAPQWNVKMSDSIADVLDGYLKLGEVPIPKGSTVSFYRDPSFGRPGFDDIYFMPRTVPVPKMPAAPPKSASFPGALYAFLSLGAFAFVRVSRR